MKGLLNPNQIQYVLYHLSMYYEIDDLFERFRFSHENEKNSFPAGSILFNLTENDIDLENTLILKDIPVLFAAARKKKPHYSIENGNLIFHFDFLKPSFYLLSGYQEYVSTSFDKWGRYPYDQSIQKKLDVANKPLVNYYFEFIINAISQFIGEPIKNRKRFLPFGLFISHDIDKVYTHTLNRFAYKIKAAVGLTNSYYNAQTNVKHAIDTAVHIVNPFTSENPAWNFDFIRETEKKNGFNSTFYFLQKEIKHQESDYRFTDKRIKNLFSLLKNDGCEIGIHGNINSEKNQNFAQKILDELKRQNDDPIIGGRQHRLLFKTPLTAIIHKRIGLEYDATLGFAEHEGFRNSFCLPFKLFDFESNEMIDLWQFPLNVMDVTLFHYRKLSFSDSFKSIDEIVLECKKFNGLFSLLWHNTFFEEDYLPGITIFYLKLHERLKNQSANSLTGKQIVDLL